MPADEIHLNDIGTQFVVTVKDGTTAVDISTATTKQLIFKKPDGTKDTQTASFYTDGTDGIITYTIVSGDLDATGSWKLQGYIVLASGNEFYTDWYNFRVHRNL